MADAFPARPLRPAPSPASPTAPPSVDGVRIPGLTVVSAILFVALLLVGVVLMGYAQVKDASIDYEAYDESDQQDERKVAKMAAVANLLHGVGIVGLAAAVLLTGLLVGNPRFARILFVVTGVLLLAGGFTVGSPFGLYPPYYDY
ncbi:MAG TPA: hypothetical protein VI796_00570 [Candidatus Thermoplasmatota archaeon]|nr:hypothetical protein [Candidatus Thermoplasmatota archaeon]